MVAEVLLGMGIMVIVSVKLAMQIYAMAYQAERSIDYVLPDPIGKKNELIAYYATNRSEILRLLISDLEQARCLSCLEWSNNHLRWLLLGGANLVSYLCFGKIVLENSQRDLIISGFQDIVNVHLKNDVDYHFRDVFGRIGSIIFLKMIKSRRLLKLESIESLGDPPRLPNVGTRELIEDI